jgi:hypothetical protein
MDPLRAASSRARLLLALAESERDCDVLSGRPAAQLRLSLARGRAVAIAGADIEPLGDTLRALGALDARAQCVMRDGPAGMLIGTRLIAAGATSRTAVQRALRLQLVRGVTALLRSPVRGLEPIARPPNDLAPSISVDLTAAVWAGMYSIARELPANVVMQLSGTSALALTELGRRRVQALLRAEHAGELSLAVTAAQCAAQARCGPHAMLNEIELGAPSSDALVCALSRDPPAALHALRAILRVLGGVFDGADCEDAYALLFRKRRELSRKASPTALLDLAGPTSSEHVRRALRRLAQKLHPDRFEAADDRLRAVSAEVMRALSCAAGELGAHNSLAP